MASCEASETSFFSLNARERMREKKKGALRTAKLNASLASKIKTKIINNSSTIKVSLKHNNKALALALNAEKANAQRLTQDKAILQKEMEQCHFQNAVLRHRLSLLENALNEVENIAAAVRTAQLPELCATSTSFSNGQKSSLTEDSWANDIADGQLVRAAVMPMRVPISKLCDSRQQGSHSTEVQISSQHLQRPASNESPETVPVASKDVLPAGKPQSHQEDNGKKPAEAMEAQEVLLESHIFGEALCATQQNPNNLPAHAWESHPFSYEGEEMANQFLDRLSQGHVTQRRKRSTLFATSTPSSGADIFSHVGSTQAAEWSITRDSSSSSTSNTQPQLTSHSSLVSLTETAVIPHTKSLSKEIFCDQPQAKETDCSVEMDPSYSQVPEFVHVKAESKGKTVEKTAIKKAITGKKKTNAIKTNAESSSDIPQVEESVQNAKQFLQPKVPTCCSESEVSKMRKKACVGAFNRDNRGFDVEQHSCSLGKFRDLRRTYVVNPAQLHSPGSGDLLEQGKKKAIFEIQSMESLSKSPVCTFSSHKVSSDDFSVQNSLLLRKETSSACVLQEDSSMSKKSIRQRTNRKTRVIRQSNCCDEENLLNTVKIPEAEAEEQPKISQTSRRKSAVITTIAFPDKEVVLGPCTDVGGVVKKSTKDSSGNLKCSRKTYIIHPLDFAGNLGCVQTEFEGGEILPTRSISGSKASKISRVRKMVAAQRSKEQRGVLEAEGQTEVAKEKNASEKEACPRLKSQKKRSTSRPPEADSLTRQSDGAKALIGTSAERASKQNALRGQFSCITDLLSVPDAFLKEQIAEMSLTNNHMDLSHSPESSPVTCPATLPVNSSPTDVPVSKSLSADGNRNPVLEMPEKSPVWLENSLPFKEKTAETPEERNQAESSSQNPPSQEPEMRPLQNLTNTRTLSSSSEVARRSARKRQDPGCYAEPKLNSKLRRGDPFTNTAFLCSPIYKKSKTAKAKETTKKTGNNGSLKECASVKTGKQTATGRDTEPEVK